MAKVASSLKIRVTCHFGRRTHIFLTAVLLQCLEPLIILREKLRFSSSFVAVYAKSLSPVLFSCDIGWQSSILFPRNNLTTVSKMVQLRPELEPCQRQHLKERRIRRKYFKQPSNHLRRENDCETSVKCFFSVSFEQLEVNLIHEKAFRNSEQGKEPFALNTCDNCFFFFRSLFSHPLFFVTSASNNFKPPSKLDLQLKHILRTIQNSTNKFTFSFPAQLTFLQEINLGSCSNPLLNPIFASKRFKLFLTHMQNLFR